MKQTIRLKESELKRMISESVRRILGESCWYGDTKPLRKYYKQHQKLVKNMNM